MFPILTLRNTFSEGDSQGVVATGTSLVPRSLDDMAADELSRAFTSGANEHLLRKSFRLIAHLIYARQVNSTLSPCFGCAGSIV